MARVYKDTRSGRYGIDFVEPSGTRKRKVVGTKAEAQKALARVTTQILDGEYKGAGTARRVTLQSVVTLWFEERQDKRSLFADRNNLDRLLRILGPSYRVGALGLGISSLRENLRAEGLGPATRNRHFANLRAALNLAVRRRMLASNPLALFQAEPEPPPPDRVLSEAEEGQLLAAASPRDRLLLVAALDTGARCGELANAHWTDLDLDAGEWRFPVTKTGKPRTVPLTPRVVAELRSWKAQPEIVMHRDRKRMRAPGHPAVFCGVTSSSLSTSFATLRKRSGIDHIRLHDLRHTCATRMRRRGVHAVTISAMLGHSSSQMLQRYQHVTVADLRLAIS